MESDNNSTLVDTSDSMAHPNGIVNVVSVQIGSVEVNVQNAVTGEGYVMNSN